MKRRSRRRTSTIVTCVLMLALLPSCQTMQAIPSGPTVTALPGDTKPAEAFRKDDEACRQYARAHADEIASARPSLVAGDGAGSVIGGFESAEYAGSGLQRRYNEAYVQCMYVEGNKVHLLALERWPGARSPWPPDPAMYVFPYSRRVETDIDPGRRK